MGRSRKALHVEYSGGKWIIRSEGEVVPAHAKYDTQKQAVVDARRKAKKARGALVIHGRDGRIRDIDRYGSGASAQRLVPSAQ